MFYPVYGILWLVSLLPFRVLYFLSDALYGLIYYVIGYRKKVVMSNLQNAFPEKTEKERIQIAKKFYHNLVDYFIESIKLITLTDKQFYKRCSGNFDEINRLAQTGINIQLHSGHQFNWEYANRIYSQKLIIPFVLVYMPVSSKIMDRIFKKIRSKHGTILINSKNYKNEMLGIYKQQHALGLVVDQSAANLEASFWLNFFSKATPFLYTPEKSAQRSKVPIGFSSFKRIKRGYYKFETTIISLDASTTENGELTKKYRDFLELQIREQPDNYLWSHKRWKHGYKSEYAKRWID